MTLEDAWNQATPEQRAAFFKADPTMRIKCWALLLARISCSRFEELSPLQRDAVKDLAKKHFSILTRAL